jgi:hypothetical protein
MRIITSNTVIDYVCYQIQTVVFEDGRKVLSVFCDDPLEHFLGSDDSRGEAIARIRQHARRKAGVRRRNHQATLATPHTPHRPRRARTHA